jgi:hypothetical protein
MERLLEAEQSMELLKSYNDHGFNFCGDVVEWFYFLVVVDLLIWV